MPKRRNVKIDPDQIILKSRKILLFGKIDETMSGQIIKQLLILNHLSHKPIILLINSGGGCVTDGFAVIDAMKGIQSPVVTMIMGTASSMAGLISIAGDARLMTKNSMWMSHDLTTGSNDYVTKFITRADHVKEVQKRVFAYLAKHTKLSQADLTKARNQELWLYAEDCKKKGIVDKII